MDKNVKCANFTQILKDRSKFLTYQFCLPSFNVIYLHSEKFKVWGQFSSFSSEQGNFGVSQNYHKNDV